MRKLSRTTIVDILVALGHRQIGFLAAAPNGAHHDYSPALRSLTTPPLTTLNPLGYAIGYKAGKMLIDQLEGRINTTSQVLMPVQLIVRGSTAPVRRDGSAATIPRSPTTYSET